MYEQSAAWHEYYRELEPEQRRKLLDELVLTGPDDGANEYRQLLFKVRYEDEKAGGRYVDRFLFQCVNLLQVHRSARIFKRSAKREVEKLWEQLLFDAAADYGEAGERALYWELRNAAARYFKSCQSPDYARSLFGFMKSGDVNRQERMARDAWEMSEGLALRLGLEEKLRIWRDAVHDSFLMCESAGEKLWAKASDPGQR